MAESEGEIARDVLDIRKALDMMGDDEDLLREALAIFMADLPRKLEELRHGLRDNDLERVKRAAHTLKGASASICAENVRGISQKMEESALSGDLDAVSQSTPQLEQELKKLAAAITLQ